MHAVIWHQAFVLYPERWREVVWWAYHEAVEAYLRHCGYIGEAVADVG
jgi:hypothetical protein